MNSDLVQWAADNGVRFVRKDHSALHRLIGWFLMLFGYDYMRRAWTTIGRTIAYPVTGPWVKVEWESTMDMALDAGRYLNVDLPAYLAKHPVTVRHEIEHVKQFKRLWHLHSLLYLFGPLPLLLNPYRAWAELIAYAPGVASGDRDGEQVVQTLWKVYFFPLPRWVMRRWLARMVEKVDAG